MVGGICGEPTSDLEIRSSLRKELAYRPLFLNSQKDLFLKQRKGYAEVLDKSTAPFSPIKEVFEHCA